jgi:hypothetical protein
LINPAILNLLFRENIDLAQGIERKQGKKLFVWFELNFHDACYNFYISEI